MKQNAKYWKQKYEETNIKLSEANTIISLLSNDSDKKMSCLIANVVYDFAAFLTCRQTVLTVSCKHDAGAMCEAIKEFEMVKLISLNPYTQDVDWKRFCNEKN